MQVEYNDLRTRTNGYWVNNFLTVSLKNKPELVESSGHGQQDDASEGSSGFFMWEKNSICDQLFFLSMRRSLWWAVGVKPLLKWQSH